RPLTSVLASRLHVSDSHSPCSDRSQTVILSSEQEAVLNKVRAGRSIFFTGAAGTGKSLLLREIVQWARGVYGKDRVAVTASTGLASINIGGCTIYSWAGIGLGKEKAEALLSIIKNASWDEKKKTRKRYVRQNSPLMRWLGCKLLILDEGEQDWIGRQIGEEDKPYGAIQVITCPRTNQISAYITTEFVDMLNALRIGGLSEDHVQKFKALDRPITCPEGMEPVQLFPLKDNVNKANSERLEQLEGDPRYFHSVDWPGFTKYGDRLPDHIFKNALTRMVALQIVALKNLVAGTLVNGSMGKVIGFKLAREAFEEDIDFALPQCLNRATKDGGKLRQRDAPDELLTSEKLWPLVEFTKSGKRLLCVPSSFETVNASGRVEATRYQVPLIPAWALSVHKSQGMTIDYLKVDLARSFEYGQGKEPPQSSLVVRVLITACSSVCRAVACVK
ncbi:PIF1-like helicase-domain-containing protein, partial [Irpex rosettiformis]